MVGVLGTQQVDLGAGEVDGEGSTGVGPLVGAADELGASLVGPAVGELEGPVLDVDDVHAVGGGAGELKALAGLVHAHLADHGHLVVGGGHGDPHLIAPDGAGAHQTLGADGLAGLHLVPLAAGIAILHFVGVDALAVLDGLFHAHHVEALHAAQVDEQGALVGAVLGGPVGGVVAVDGVAGLVGHVIATDVGGLHGGGQVLLKGFLDVLAELGHTVQNGLVHGALVVGGHVEQEGAVVAHGAEVHLAQGGNGLGGVLGGAPEPAGGDAGITLGHGPLVAVFQAHGVAALRAAVDGVVFVVHHGLGPGVVGGVAVLVADPAHGGVGLSAEEHTVGLIAGLLALVALNGVKPLLEVVLLSVGAGALGAVHPHLDEVAVVAVLVVAQDLLELVVVVLVVVQHVVFLAGGVAVGVVVAVAVVVDIPGRQIQAHVHVVLGAGLGQLSQNVALAVLVAGVGHIVLGVGTVPDTEAVVVLGGDDEHLEAGVLQSLDHGVSVEVGLQLEDLIGGLVPVVLAPLDLVEGVGAKVAESGQLCLLIPILIGVGQNGVRGGGWGGVVGERRIPDVGGLCGPSSREAGAYHSRGQHGPRQSQSQTALSRTFSFHVHSFLSYVRHVVGHAPFFIYIIPYPTCHRYMFLCEIPNL